MSDYRNDRFRRTTRGGNPGRQYAHAPQGYRPMSGRRVRPVWFIVIMDLLVMGLALNAFALGNSSLFAPSSNGEDIPQPSAVLTGSPSPSPSAKPSATTTATQTASSTATGTQAPTASPTDTPSADQGMFGAKFAGKFTDGQPVITDDSYQSHDISITITKDQSNGIEFDVADIYIRNLANFQTFFHNDAFGGSISSTLNEAKTRNAILAINGDNSGNRANHSGYEARNGKLYRKIPWQDVLVMYRDGSMKTFDNAGFDEEYKTISQTGGNNGGAWQIWSFGPMLLDAGGQAMTQFAPESITGSGNERTAIGYYEPGHYCFVTVGSADKESRAGMSLADLSQKMHDLGCKLAYNMDGGQSSEMVFNGQFVNTPYKGGRSVNDIICIGEAN